MTLSHTFLKSDVLYCVNSLEFHRVSRVHVVGRLNDKTLTRICARVLVFLQRIDIIDNPTKLRGNTLFTLRKTNASMHDNGC